MAVEDIVIKMSVEGEEALIQALKISGLSMKQFNKHLQTNALLLQKNNTVIDRLTGKQLVLGNVMRQGMIQARRFKMEWLSIMFAGMALSRAFGGLVKAQLQLFGVTDGLSSMWTVVMLPIMEKITPFLWKMIDAFMNMPEGLQLAIGGFVILMAVMGTVLMIVGQVFLGFMGFKTLMGGKGLGATIKALQVSLMGLSATFLIIFAVVAAVAIGIFLAWKTNFLNIREDIAIFVSAFKQFFGGLVNIVKGIMNVIKGIFSGDFETVKKGIIQIFSGLWNALMGGFVALGAGVVIIFKGVVKLIWNVFKVVIDAVLWVADKASRLFGGGGVSFRMPSFQTGGLVTQTGPALLHRGEKVVPKGRESNGNATFAPTVNIQATINNDMDVRTLATKLNEYWVRDFERITQSRN